MAFAQRLAPSDALAHRSRQLIVAALEGRRGLTAPRLAQACGIGRGSVLHHLRVLAVLGLVRCFRFGARTYWVGRDQIDLLGRWATHPTGLDVALFDPTLGAAIAAAQAGPRRLSDVVRAVMDAASVTRIGAWKAVRRAQRMGFVAVEGSRSHRVVSIAPTTAPASIRPCAEPALGLAGEGA